MTCPVRGTVIGRGTLRQLGGGEPRLFAFQFAGRMLLSGT